MRTRSLFFLLEHYGLDDGHAASVVLLYRVLPLSIALVGGLVYLLGDRPTQRAPADREVELGAAERQELAAGAEPR